MELKDMILSTLKELEEVVPKEEQLQTLQPPRKRELEREREEVEFEPEPLLEITEEINAIKAYAMPHEIEDESCHENQKQFYVNLRERILVLFEGFQSPNNKNIEAKIDLTLNFLEYLLATIDEQLEQMDTLKK